MTFKRIFALMAAMLFAVITVSAVASPASADSVPIASATCGPECERPVGVRMAPPTNCLYNYSACGYESAFHNCDDGCEVITRTSPGCEAAALSNQWSSYYNNSGRTTRLYDSNNCTGSYLTYYSGTGDGYFLINHPDWENKVSSVRFI